MNISIVGYGYNTELLRNRHVIQSTAIGLYVRGLKRNRELYPDGRVRTPDVNARLPSLRLYFPDGVSEYEYDDIRENWWIAFGDPTPVYYDSATRQAMFRTEGGGIPIKAEIPLAPAQIPTIRMAFNDIRTGWDSGTAMGRATAELILASLLATFLKSEYQLAAPTLADRYRQLIDADVHWSHTLEELGGQLNLSRDEARACFQEKYRVTPGKYRMQRRLARIMELITSSNLSVKEIAWECGLRNVTYLNAVTRRHFDSTPTALIRHFRRVLI